MYGIPILICKYLFKTQNFEQILQYYDVVLNSQDNKTLEKFLNI